MYCIFGLGNPGKKYHKTKHNVGFLLCDVLAGSQNKQFTKGAGPYWQAEVKLYKRDVLLIKPSTYMNRSGIAFDDVQKRYAIANDTCMVVFDDFHLPPGKIRIRPHGSDGGHNGLGSVINYARTMKVPRMRIGIGKPDKTGIVDYVLSGFSPSEMHVISQTIERSVQAMETWIKYGIEKTMSDFN